MDQSEKFSDYLFAKMGPPIIGNNDAECPRKTTDSCEAPVELTGLRKWLSENLMLLVTLFGVFLGVILGKYFFLISLFQYVLIFSLCARKYRNWYCFIIINDHYFLFLHIFILILLFFMHFIISSYTSLQLKAEYWQYIDFVMPTSHVTSFFIRSRRKNLLLFKVCEK